MMTITLHLLHSATRRFIFTVIDVDRSKAPCWHTIKVDWEASMEDL